MGDGAPKLEDELLKWANENEARKNKWLTELIKNDIDNMQTLKEWADDEDAFNALCATVSMGLRVKLRSWFKRTYPDSKTSLLRIENSPYFC
jgi:hypothetical protein